MVTKPILAAVVVASLTLSACSEYQRRAEGVSPFAGDAVRTNIAIHTIDPWPRGANKNSLVIGADRQVERMKTFKNPQPIQPSGGIRAASPVFVNPPTP